MRARSTTTTTRTPTSPRCRAAPLTPTLSREGRGGRIPSLTPTLSLGERVPDGCVASAGGVV